MLKTVLSKEQLEVESRLLLEARSIANGSISAEVIDLVNDIIIIDNDNVDETDIRDNIQTGFEKIIEDIHLSTSTVLRVTAKRYPDALKHDKWREITQKYMMYKNSISTIQKYFLKNGNLTHNYWTATFSRWRRGYVKVPILGRVSALGKVIEAESALIVENYRKHSIPITNHILRLNIVTLLTNHHRDYLIARMDADVLPKDRLCFGQRWFQRLYKRLHFTGRVATTQMRDEIRTDYEITLHLSMAINDHNIPDELICAGDEINTQFLSSVRKSENEI